MGVMRGTKPDEKMQCMYVCMYYIYTYHIIAVTVIL